MSQKISFGIIVLNGEPFTKYCLRSLYPFAHEIIIVEGATENAKTISTPDGHSTDLTLKSINEFLNNEDPEKKVRLITRDGFWNEKNEMCAMYTSKATGNYLWQIDIDEFYLKEDMEKIVSILKNDPEITAISFRMKSFWGGTDYLEEGPIFGDTKRLFKFGPGYRYTNHRPPTVIDNNGKNLREIKWLNGRKMASKYHIYMYHYGFIFPLQVEWKRKYYNSLTQKNSDNWVNNYYNLANPFHVNNNYWRVSWLRKYNGRHPAQILEMMHDIKEKKIDVTERDHADIEKLLGSKKYIICTYFLRFYFKVIYIYKQLIKNTLITFRILKTR